MPKTERLLFENVSAFSSQSGLCPQPKSARRSAVPLTSRPLRGAPRWHAAL